MTPRLLPADALTDTDLDAVTALLRRSFEGVTRAGVERDLADKTHALLLREGATLVGVSTLAAFSAQDPSGGEATVVCSGDTVVDRDAWGSPALAQAWVRSVRGLPGAGDGTSLYWLLICSGFRTYRFLPVFFERYVPGVGGRAAPEAWGPWSKALARARFGDAFDEEAGVVRLAHPQPLRAGLAGVPAGRRGQRDVARFVALNPGHAHGDELVCFTSLADANLTAAGRRMLGPTDSDARP